MLALSINGNIYVNAYASVVFVYNATSALYCATNKPFLCYSSTLYYNLSISMLLNVQFSTNGCAWRHTPTYMWREQAKTKAHIYVMYMKFLRTNYCIRKRWPVDPFSKVWPPWLKLLVTPLIVTEQERSLAISTIPRPSHAIRNDKSVLTAAFQAKRY